MLGARHFAVVLGHDQRFVSSHLFAVLLALWRFLLARFMLGSVTEFYSDNGNQLLAWSMETSKGSTLRAVWFYQANAAIDAKLYIWFASLRLTMQRAFATKRVQFVDLGPSATAAVLEVKARFGFEVCDDWRALCDYSGDLDVPVRAETSMLI